MTDSASVSKTLPLEVRHLGVLDYTTTWTQMRSFTDGRDESSADQLWLVQHPAVFTLGQAGLMEHVMQPGDIPIVESDRGGQVTYHGPGQLVAYTMFDLRRLGCGIRQLVSGLEESVISVLEYYELVGERLQGAPGVYVGGAKMSALGLRVRKGCSYHGLSLNVDMDLEPFSRINPCGYPGLAVTQLSALNRNASMSDVTALVADAVAEEFGFELARAIEQKSAI